MNVLGISRPVVALLLSIGLIPAAEAQPASGENCTFRNDPQDFLARESRNLRAVNSRTIDFSGRSAVRATAAVVNAADLPHRNLIDEEILGRLERDRIPAAALTTDEEFVRRIYLDLIGRLPKFSEYREFVQNTEASKRDALIERLIFSPDFTYRWAAWLGDLTGNVRTAFNVNLQNDGRNALNNYLRDSVSNDKSLRDLTWELITAQGNNYDNGPANWVVRSVTPGGPVQDRYDTMMVHNMTTFLGLGHYDCLACHDGRGHLDQVSLWAKSVPRSESYRLSAFFARQTVAGRPQTEGDFYRNSFDASLRVSGTYDLNTTYGNRPNRVKIGTLVNITPEYRDGTPVPTNTNWPEAFAAKITADPMFAKNLVNRIWKQIFNLALADPVDLLDPARLDPDSPPAAPWTYQTSHPKLLQRLAATLMGNNYSLRETVRLMVSSTAYQLSSQYGAQWKLDYVPLYARHYTRRLEAEEIHDNLAQASGNYVKYTIPGFAAAVTSAWQFPDTSEPQSNGGVRNFLDTFLRGNRDTQPRSQAGSILQQLSIMNDPFVRDRIKVNTAGNVAVIARYTDASQIVDELFITYLGRVPLAAEKQAALTFLSKANTAALKNAAVEDLTWAIVNKIEFLFSY